MWVELFTGKLPDPPNAKERGRTLLTDETFYSKSESTSAFYIDKNHLKGRIRSLSEGAVERKYTYMEDDDYSSPNKYETESKPLIKSPSCKF